MVLTGSLHSFNPRALLNMYPTLVGERPGVSRSTTGARIFS
jgi:hypothetical protein